MDNLPTGSYTVECLRRSINGDSNRSLQTPESASAVVAAGASVSARVSF